MSRLFMGWKSGVGSVLKVMANDTDDPLTTPNTDYSKFRFNSETGKIGYVYETYEKFWNTTAYPLSPALGTEYLYFDGGETATNAKQWTTCWRVNRPGVPHVMEFNLNLTKKFGFTYPPIVEFRKRTSTGRYIKNGDAYIQADEWEGPINYYWGQFSYQANMGFVVKQTTADATRNVSVNDYTCKVGLTTEADYSSWFSNFLPQLSVSAFSPASFPSLAGVGVSSTETAVGVIWDLPADNTPLPSNGAYSAGKKMIALSPTIVKVARGGFDVDTASYDQLILSSEKVPAKIIASGDLSVNANSSNSITIPAHFPLTGTVFVDYLIWVVGQPLFIPFQREDVSAWSGSEVFVEYQISGQVITFYNTRGLNVSIRYLVCADDAEGNSSGSGGKVIETGSGFQRILRPSSNPSSLKWSDILLDTRASYLPILSEGYIPIASFFNNTIVPQHRGFKRHDITFSNGGLKPFLKYSIVLGNNVTSTPLLRKLICGDGYLQPTCFSAVARLTDTAASFYTNPDGLVARYHTTGVNWANVYPTINEKVIGIRYYIFGIPV